MSEDERDDRDQGFTVVDRRGGKEGEATAAGERDAETELPKVEFTTFCLSLGTSALFHLGIIGDPETGEKAAAPNLPVARQTIDVLEMLKAKTRGNLDEEESRMLEGLLYELHMRFVEASKPAPPDEKAGE